MSNKVIYVMTGLSGFGTTTDPSDKQSITLIPNNKTGVQLLAQHARELGPDSDAKIIFTGNKRWAILTVLNLMGLGITNLHYLPLAQAAGQKGKRGKAGDLCTQVAKLLQKGELRTKPFIARLPREKVPDPQGIQLMKTYMAKVRDVHQAKHRVRNCLYLIFPECINPGEDAPKSESQKVPEIWETEMRTLLENPRLDYWADKAKRKIRFERLIYYQSENGKKRIQARTRKRLTELGERLELLANDSLGHALKDQMSEMVEQCNREYTILLAAEQAKEAAMQDVRDYVLKNLNDKTKQMLQDFGGGDTIIAVLALLMHQDWPVWTHLRSYAGLSLNRHDQTFPDKLRIGRNNQLLTTRMFLLFLTNKGKEIGNKVPRERLGKDGVTIEKVHNRTVKKLEKLLKFLWRMYLCEKIKEPVPAV